MEKILKTSIKCLVTQKRIHKVEQIKKQLARKPRELPKMKINRETENIEDFVYEDFELIDYNPHKGIKGKVAV